MRPIQTSHATPPGRVLYQSQPGEPGREWFVYRPASARPGGPLLVVVHGIACNPAEYVFRMADAAERRGVVVAAPLFAKGAYGQYQQVIDPRSGVRADLALLDIITEVARATDADDERVHLFGVSGGAQFAHRFAMMHPEAVASVGLAAAGWYTFPDAEQAWPLGLAGHPLGVEGVDPAFLDLPWRVFVGERDVERDVSLRKSDALDTLQGRDRLQRARAWVEAMRARGADVSLTLIPDTGHALGRAFERRALADLILDPVAPELSGAPLKAVPQETRQ
ncbi:MAG: hypothetical protein K1X35_02945 [Caulobacteraceae bacterium]|nr:hypothetical protein [Caulobacteraceae bacterium]